MLTLLTYIVLSFSVVTAAAAPDKYDLIIVGCVIVDGTGGDRTRSDVGVLDGRIVAVGDLSNAKAALKVDAKGLVVAPGFIDVHNHSDRVISAKSRRFNEGFVRQGVTTVVGGPDGGLSPSQMRRLIERFETNGIGTNVALYVGHNAIRGEVMQKDQQRAPSLQELDRMKALVLEGMELGAVGLSTGLMYEPGMFSTTGEVAELAIVVAPFNGIYDSHVRDPVNAFLASHTECAEIGRRAGIPAKLGHLKGVGLHNAGVIHEVIAMVESARTNGENVVSDQYPYDGAATSTLRNIIIVPPELSKGGFDLVAALRDPRQRNAIKHASENGIEGGFAWLKATGYRSMRITNSEDYPELVGQYLSELAVVREQTGFDLVSELLVDAKEKVHITLGAIKEEDVRALMVQPWNMIASDGEYVDTNPKITGGHPRSTGTFPRVLGHYVREEGVLTLEEAIRKMTSLPAEFIGLLDRGKIAEGYAADITVFDPETIIDRSTWVEPRRMPDGVHHVFVNGIPVLASGELTGESPGQYLKRQR